MQVLVLSLFSLNMKKKLRLSGIKCLALGLTAQAGFRSGSDSSGLVLKHCVYRPSDLEVQLVTEEQGRPQSNALSFKGRAEEEGFGNADPQALNCNLATQAFLCVITPQPAMQSYPPWQEALRELCHSLPQGKSGHTLL